MAIRSNLFLITVFLALNGLDAFMSPLTMQQQKTSPLVMNMVEESGSDKLQSGMMQRRAALGSIFGASLAFASLDVANALDMDAFANSELASDQKNCNPKTDPKCIPVLSSDEALCKYGQSGNARGEACKRVKESGKSLPTSKPQGKSLGGAYAM